MQSSLKTRQQAVSSNVVRIGSVLSRAKRVSDSPPPPDAPPAKKTLASIAVSPENKQGEIFKAVERGDADMLQELLQDCGPEIREKDSGNTLLHAASLHGHLDIARVLLELISPNTTNTEGQTPTHLAACRGHLEVLEVLLKDVQFKPEKKDKSGRTYKDMLSVPLVKAITNRHSRRVEELLELGANADHELDGMLVRELSITSPRSLANTLFVGNYRPYIKSMFETTQQIKPVIKKKKDFIFSINKDNVKPGPLRVAVGPRCSVDVDEDTYTPAPGFVTVLSYSRFQDRPDLSLAGATHDVLNLESVFGNMGWSGHTFNNLTGEETRAAVEEVRGLDAFDNVGCAVFVVSSWGLGGETFLTADRQMMEVRWLMDSFKDSLCPQLKGKPKIFIFDITCSRSEDVHVDLQSHIPEDEPGRDMACIFTSTAGSTPYTHTKEGTPFLMALCRTLARSAGCKEFGELYRELQKEYAKSAPNSNLELRTLGLTKKIYLNPFPPKQ